MQRLFTFHPHAYWIRAIEDSTADNDATMKSSYLCVCRYPNPFTSPCVEKPRLMERAEDEYQVPSSHPVCLTQPPICISVRVPNRYRSSSSLSLSLSLSFSLFFSLPLCLSLFLSLSLCSSLFLSLSSSLCAALFQRFYHFLIADGPVDLPGPAGNCALCLTATDRCDGSRVSERERCWLLPPQPPPPRLTPHPLSKKVLYRKGTHDG